MIAILSSAKTLDFESPWQAPATTQPECGQQAKVLLAQLKPLSSAQLSKLLGVSLKLATLNAERFTRLSLASTIKNAKPAILAYQGDVYRGMRSAAFDVEDLTFSQGILRIISGLYGVLRPLDLIQPYRLEMATKLAGPDWKDLHAYWSDRVTRLIDRDAQASDKKSQVILNLASQEYSSVLNRERLTVPVLTLSFKQNRKGRIQMVPILAKRARGLMAHFLVTRRILQPDALKTFQEDGYRFDSKTSTRSEWVFIRG